MSAAPQDLMTPYRADSVAKRLTESAGVRECLDCFAKRYYEPLTTFFYRRTRDRQEAQDLVQQVFLRLAQSRNINAVMNSDGYVFQTAANALKNHRRDAAVRERLLGADLTDPAFLRSDLSPERVLLGRESIDLLVSRLRDLPERTRDIVILRCFAELTHGEIARRHGLSTRSVEKHVQRGMLALSSALSGAH